MQSVVDNNLKFGPEITWPKEFPELKTIDDSLHCGICYEYLKTVMVTPCAHSFCSICIRKYLSYKTACPVCFEEVFETNLRNNRILDTIVLLFSQIRDKLIKHLKIAALHFNCNEKIASSFTPSQSNATQRASVPSETPKNSSKKLVSKGTSKGKLNFSNLSSPSTSTSFKKSEISKRLEDILGSPGAPSGQDICDDTDSLHPAQHRSAVIADCELNVPTVPSMFLKEPQPNQLNLASSNVPVVSCPVCLVDIPERNINSHLDNCLANVDKPVKSPVKKKLKRNPLPKMVWHMMAEKDLRKKLKDYGLNTQGDKRSLISRIQRYIVLYNSECDSENPRSVADIIRQVEREEKQIPVVTQQRLVMNKKTDPKVIEEENKKYIEENKSSFSKLIKAMRQREGRNIRPIRPVNRISDDSSDDDDGSKKKNNKENEANNLSKCDKALEIVNLCESRSSSPVLGSWVDDKPIPNGLPAGSPGKESEDMSSEDIFLPTVSRHKKATVEENKLFSTDDIFQSEPRQDESSTEENKLSSEGDEKIADVQEDFCDAEALFHSSPSRPPSPSCIITAHSDSEDSISILINQNIDEELDTDQVESATEKIEAGKSQLCDPDFVPGTEDQETEEVFVEKRKPKRKSKEIKEIPSPRRTRRRLNKQ